MIGLVEWIVNAGECLGQGVVNLEDDGMSTDGDQTESDEFGGNAVMRQYLLDREWGLRACMSCRSIHSRRRKWVLTSVSGLEADWCFVRGLVEKVRSLQTLEMTSSRSHTNTRLQPCG